MVIGYLAILGSYIFYPNFEFITSYRRFNDSVRENTVFIEQNFSTKDLLLKKETKSDGGPEINRVFDKLYLKIFGNPIKLIRPKISEVKHRFILKEKGNNLDVIINHLNLNSSDTIYFYGSEKKLTIYFKFKEYLSEEEIVGDEIIERQWKGNFVEKSVL